jgi:hypothetical protein
VSAPSQAERVTLRPYGALVVAVALVVVVLVVVVAFVSAPFDDVVVFVVVVVSLLAVFSAGLLQAVTLAAARTASETRAKVRTCVMGRISRCEREIEERVTGKRDCSLSRRKCQLWGAGGPALDSVASVG